MAVTNKCPNASFESGFAEYLVPNAGTSGAIDTSDAFHGDQCLRVSGTGTAARELNLDPAFAVPTTPGSIWSAGARAKPDGGTPKNVRCDLRWLDASRADLSSSNGVSTLTVADTWTQGTSLNKTAPVGTAFVRIRVTYAFGGAAIAGDAILLDALQIEPGATLPAFNVGLPGVAGDSLRTSLNRLAGTTGLDEQAAANVWAGTNGLDIKGAINVKNTTSGFDLKKCLNDLAGTVGLDEQGAAWRIAA